MYGRPRQSKFTAVGSRRVKPAFDPHATRDLALACRMQDFFFLGGGGGRGEQDYLQYSRENASERRESVGGGVLPPPTRGSFCISQAIQKKLGLHVGLDEV